MRWLTSFVAECTNSKVLVLDEHICIIFFHDTHADMWSTSEGPDQNSQVTGWSPMFIVVIHAPAVYHYISG